MSKRTIFIVSVIIGVFAIGSVIAYSVAAMQRQQYERTEKARIAKTVQVFGSNGVVSSTSNLKTVMDIQLKYRQNHVLSDQDIETLSKVTAGPTDAIVQSKAAATLFTANMNKAIPDAKKEYIAQTTLPALTSSESLVRLTEARLLGELRQKSSLTPLLRAVADPDPNVKKMALRSLRDLGYTGQVQ